MFLTSVRRWPGCTLKALDPAQTIPLLANGKLVAVVAFANGELFGLLSDGGFAKRVAIMRQLAALYKGPPAHEVCSETNFPYASSELLRCHSQANAVISFQPLSKDAVLTAACHNEPRLPPGITRHIVTCGRVLHIDVPLALLRTNLPTEEKTQYLHTMLAAKRWRLYTEPTIQYESY